MLITECLQSVKKSAEAARINICRFFKTSPDEELEMSTTSNDTKDDVSYCTDSDDSFNRGPLKRSRSSLKSQEHQKNRVCNVMEDSDEDSWVLVNSSYKSSETLDEGMQKTANLDKDEQKFVVSIGHGPGSERRRTSTSKKKSKKLKKPLNISLPLETLFVKGPEPRLSRSLSSGVRISNFQ